MDTLYKKLSDKLHIPILVDYLLYSGSVDYKGSRPTEEDAWVNLYQYLEQHGQLDNDLLDRFTEFTGIIQENYLLAGIKLGAQIANEFSLSPQDVERVEQVLVTNTDRNTVMKEVAQMLRSFYLRTSDEETRKLLADVDVMLQSIMI